MTMPLSGTINFVIGRLGHAMINLPTKSEVRSVTCYGDIICVAKCENGVVWSG